MVNTQELTKRYYTIGEVAEMFDVSTSLIRYWEKEFSNIKPHKNAKGDRRFTPKTIKQLNLVYHLVKERGFTIDGARNELHKQSIRLKQKRKLKNKLLSLKKRIKSLSLSLVLDEEE